MVRELRYILAVLIGVSMMVSCVDEPIIQGSGDIPEGYAKVSASVSYKPFGSTLGGDSRAATAGDAIKDIKTLYVLLYDEGGELVTMFNAKEAEEYSEEKHEYTIPKTVLPENEHNAESSGICAKFKKVVPYGNYKIYAVANVDLSIDKYSASINTESGLKSISFNWDASNIGNNNQMFGFFTTDKVVSKPTGFDAPLVTIASPNVNLHAWIRRLASKVTIAYDGSGLNDNVFIRLQSVQIKHIPKTCFLGNDNKPTGDNTEEGIAAILQDGETIEYADENTNHSNWPTITNGTPYYWTGAASPTKNEEFRNVAHSETTDALFFYENMQGVHPELDKRQDADGDGVLDYPGLPNDDTYRKKDGVPYGTYIEVTAYYENNIAGINSSGEIFYRFMLGKDTRTNYDAERNYHYKLTLKFKGNANDVDWHIEYEEPPGIYMPDYYFISYLYDQTMNLPVRIVGEIEGDLEAEIVQNDWYPSDGTVDEDYFDPSKVITTGKEVAGGFLSLRRTHPDDRVAISGDRVAGNNVYWTDKEQGSRKYTTTASGEYNSYVNGYLTADTDKGGNHGDGKYVVIKEDGVTNFLIPFFTRSKNLIASSGYTGNNPYWAHSRRARVKFTATINGTKTFKYVDIYQVRRLANPTGVWRRNGNSAPFDVTLMATNPASDGKDSFEPVISQGPWTATVEKGDWIKINGKTQITGSTSTPIEFKITGFTATNDNSVKCGYIRVTYHNNTCHHLIMVRQGYAPLALVYPQGNTTGARWHSFNLRYLDNTPINQGGTANVYTAHFPETPVDEGSMFRRGNWFQAIDEINNYVSQFGVYPGKYSGLHLAPYIPDVQNWACWHDITSESIDWPTDVWTHTGSLPSASDWKEFEHFDKVYGVLYADEVNEVQATSTAAYGYSESQGKARGMRGVFVYDTEGNNLFFPIGATGHGHRKARDDYYGYTKPNYENNYGAGVLRYAQRPEVMGVGGDNIVEQRPLFWDIYLREGAIYWTSDPDTEVDDEPLSWDLNYYTYNFASYGENAVPGYAKGGSYFNEDDPYYPGISDAAFIRLVSK